jgi:hypothetical protein
MRSAKARHVGATAICLAMLSHAAPSFAQGVEVSPFYGYRFGGSFVELYTPLPFDFDGAPATGVVFDVRLYDSDDFQIEGLFSHQAADVLVAPAPGRPFTQWRVSADHWLAGGLQEFSAGAVRGFTTGMLGLTRFAAEGNSEFRFTLSTGAGVKMFADRTLGVRLDGRVFATFVDGSGNAIACTPGVCLVGLHVNVAWQAEFTAGLIFRFQ